MTDAAHKAVERYLVCGVPIAAASMDDVMDVLAESRWGEHRAIHFCNTYTLSLVGRHPDLGDTLRRSTMNLPDGWPVAAIGRRLKVPGESGQIPGPDAFETALRNPAVRAKRHFLFGATQEIIDRMHDVLTRDFPHANVVGSVAPPFGGLEAILTEENLGPLLEAQPDIVWVGLGTPLQDRFMGTAGEQVPATLVGVGAAFDFRAGTMRRAPALMRRTRMEWLWRFAREPRRLWRRYLLGSARFIGHNLRTRPSVLARL